MNQENVIADILSRHGAMQGAGSAATPALTGSMVYVNELGSTASFDINGNTVTGTYTSMVSRTGKTISGPITGWANGYVICWTVMWPTNPPSMTTWAGEFVKAGSGFDIDTLWYLISQTPTPGDPLQFWTAINAGSDLFKRKS